MERGLPGRGAPRQGGVAPSSCPPGRAAAAAVGRARRGPPQRVRARRRPLPPPLPASCGAYESSYSQEGKGQAPFVGFLGWLVLGVVVFCATVASAIFERCQAEL